MSSIKVVEKMGELVPMSAEKFEKDLKMGLGKFERELCRGSTCSVWSMHNASTSSIVPWIVLDR